MMFSKVPRGLISGMRSLSFCAASPNAQLQMVISVLSELPGVTYLRIDDLTYDSILRKNVSCSGNLTV